MRGSKAPSFNAEDLEKIKLFLEPGNSGLSSLFINSGLNGAVGMGSLG